jgi:hypothetical protein
MSLGSFFKSLLVGSSGTAPINEDGKYRTAGFISGEVDGEVKRIQFIRADQNADLQSAIDHSISKAQQIIDEQGVSLLNKTHL